MIAHAVQPDRPLPAGGDDVPLSETVREMCHGMEAGRQAGYCHVRGVSGQCLERGRPPARVAGRRARAAPPGSNRTTVRASNWSLPVIRSRPSVQSMTAITQSPHADHGLHRYAAVLRTPGALQFAVPGVIGRMPMGMLSIAQVMLIVSVTGRYGTAGVVSAAGAVLFAIVTPRMARLADRHGQARVLRPLAAVFAVTTVAFAFSAV